MLHIIETLFPIFAVIALGLILAKKGILSATSVLQLNRVLFWVCLPALIVHSLATVSAFPPNTGTITGIFLLATVCIIGLAWLVHRWRGQARQQFGTFIQAAFRGNLAYTGIPILLFALQDYSAETRSAALAQLMFVFAPAMLLYNAAAIFFLLGSHQQSLFSNLPEVFSKTVRNPLIIASLFGVAIFLAPFSLPKFVLGSLSLIGQMAAPAALLCVGAGLAFVSMEGRYRSACYATALKLIALPLVVILMSFGFDLDPLSRLVLLILSSCPTAVASYIMAKEMHGDEALAAGSIVLSTACSAPVLAVIIYFFGRF